MLPGWCRCRRSWPVAPSSLEGDQGTHRQICSVTCVSEQLAVAQLFLYCSLNHCLNLFLYHVVSRMLCVNRALVPSHFLPDVQLQPSKMNSSSSSPPVAFQVCSFELFWMISSHSVVDMFKFTYKAITKHGINWTYIYLMYVIHTLILRSDFVHLISFSESAKWNKCNTVTQPPSSFQKLNQQLSLTVTGILNNMETNKQTNKSYIRGWF